MLQTFFLRNMNVSCTSLRFFQKHELLAGYKLVLGHLLSCRHTRKLLTARKSYQTYILCSSLWIYWLFNRSNALMYTNHTVNALLTPCVLFFRNMFVLAVPLIRLCLLLVSVHSCYTADIPCVCCLAVEKTVYSEPDVDSDPVGYMYEFDCKPKDTEAPEVDGFYTLQFEHQVLYSHVIRMWQLFITHQTICLFQNSESNDKCRKYVSKIQSSPTLVDYWYTYDRDHISCN